MELPGADLPHVKHFAAFIKNFDSKDKVARMLQYGFGFLGLVTGQSGAAELSKNFKNASGMLSQDRKAFKLGHFVADYRSLAPAAAALAANPTDPLAASGFAKAVCSLLFTCFMNVNWFIKSGLLKWDKKYWGAKQSLVRLWVALYALFPAVAAYRRVAAKRDKRGAADRRAVREAQLKILQTVLDFFTYARTTGYDLLLLRVQLPEAVPLLAGFTASALGARSLWRSTAY